MLIGPMRWTFFSSRTAEHKEFCVFCNNILGLPLLFKITVQRLGESFHNPDESIKSILPYFQVVLLCNRCPIDTVFLMPTEQKKHHNPPLWQQAGFPRSYQLGVPYNLLAAGG